MPPENETQTETPTPNYEAFPAPPAPAADAVVAETTTADTAAADDGLEGDTLLGKVADAKEDKAVDDKAAKPDEKADEKAEDKKPDDKPDDAVPEGDYTVTLDAEQFKGMEIDAEVLAEATPALKAAGVTQAQMNVLAPVAAQLVQKGADGMQSALAAEIVATRKAWHDATVSDKEIGGTKANLDASVALAAKALDQFDPSGELRTELNRTGYGNNPLLIRMLKRVGESISESTFHPTGGSQERSGGKPDDTTLFYGDTHAKGGSA